ncbi:hypothetical protein BJY01DRAFT_217775 [Aspergillus pseudoustus]|uniref:Uncharacterized protein n=1 Tax=Aspergillus pseudoustus TaxID=1810923 RepID=A0ABR4JQ78_9EURO
MKVFQVLPQSVVVLVMLYTGLVDSTPVLPTTLSWLLWCTLLLRKQLRTLQVPALLGGILGLARLPDRTALERLN